MLFIKIRYQVFSFLIHLCVLLILIFFQSKYFDFFKKNQNIHVFKLQQAVRVDIRGMPKLTIAELKKLPLLTKKTNENIKKKLKRYYLKEETLRLFLKGKIKILRRC